MWRINKVLQFRRTKVRIRNVVWPTVVLLLITVVFLAVWSVLYGLDWERIVVNPETGESVGSCRGDSSTIWLVSGIPITLLPILLVGYMAWKTKVRVPFSGYCSALLVITFSNQMVTS